MLLMDDVDSVETIRLELELWSPKLSSDALVMLHGLDLERTDPPRGACSAFLKEKRGEFHNGIDWESRRDEVVTVAGSDFPEHRSVGAKLPTESPI